MSRPRFLAQSLTGERRNREELAEISAQLNGIIFSAMDAIISIDAEQRIVLFNPAAEKMFGVSSEDVLGQKLERLIPQRFRKAHALHVEEFGQTGVSFRRMGALGRISGLRANGEEFPIEASISQVEIEGEKLFTVILRDVSEREQAERNLRGALEQLAKAKAGLETRVQERTSALEASNQELEAFSHSVSHDLRAPLRSIRTFSGILSEDYAGQLPSDAQDLLNKVIASADRMGQLITDLLNFSKIGRTQLSMKTVDLNHLVQRVLEQLRPAQQSRQIELKVGPLPECIGDPSLLEQVFMNLLSNAFKFTRGREQAVIEVGSEDRAGEGVCYVRDNGAGFDMEHAQKLFGVFQRLHLAKEFEGTGIGLSIVKRIIDRHGGRVWAEGRVGEGAAFYFTLPNSGSASKG